ncbi:MAG: glutamine--fructose-6-phosphate transaminase (isomerizing) [Eggerthellaceae bacterium]|nr:glutamine--fructose-6-phosphate transaminase (isomerizing) [Eggerthellaceae bacterium]
MCGIVGYTGPKLCPEILIDGLMHLEYRGYDSAGVAIEVGGTIFTVCRKGKVKTLEDALMRHKLRGTCGIGHTRWATHGKPSEANAHPHTSCDGNIALVHNGIIENYAELREGLIEQGHKFMSETDSEVIAHMVEDSYKEIIEEGKPQKGVSNIACAVRRACVRLVGSYCLAVLCEDEPDVIIATCKDSPIIVGTCDEGSFVASDIIAMIDHTRDIHVMHENEIAEMHKDKIILFDSHRDFLKKISYEPEFVDWNIDVAEKGGFPDFMMKEIHEQPRVIRDTLAGRLVGGELSIEEIGLSNMELMLVDRVYIIACGTSYHAGLIAKNIIECWARISTDVEASSEFRYRDPILSPTTLVVAVSQSGETADTIAAIRDARIRGARVFGITNVVGSTVARKSNGVIYTKANKEIAVASTKSFLGQVVSLTLLAMLLGQAKGKLTTGQVRLLFTELGNTAEHVEKILSDTSAIDAAAEACKGAASALFIGRGIGSAVAYEGALKLKEISYLHAEAYPAGEMKHGPIALIDEGFPVIAIATDSATKEKLISNLQECRARGAMVVAVATEGDEEIKKHADYVIYIPRVRELYMPITASVPLQLFARAISRLRGCNVDQPRNLAKSVTVE